MSASAVNEQAVSRHFRPRREQPTMVSGYCKDEQSPLSLAGRSALERVRTED
jgi:hypothetical protein